MNIQNGLYYIMYRFKVKSSVLKGFDLNMMHMKTFPLITFLRKCEFSNLISKLFMRDYFHRQAAAAMGNTKYSVL